MRPAKSDHETHGGLGSLLFWLRTLCPLLPRCFGRELFDRKLGQEGRALVTTAAAVSSVNYFLRSPAMQATLRSEEAVSPDLWRGP